MSKLAIETISRVFPGVRGGQPTRALEPTDLKVADNDFVTILGPSGCGKSTLLRVIGALIESTHLVLLGAARGQHQNRRVGPFADLTADVGAIHVRQPEIEDHEVRPLAFEGLERLAAAACHTDRVAARSQQRSGRTLNGHLVVHEEDVDRACHRLSSSSAAVVRVSTGMAIVNTAPPSAWFSAQTRPPSAASNPRAIASPIPVPNRRSRASTPR